MLSSCICCIAKKQDKYITLRHCTLCNVAIIPKTVLNNKAMLCRLHRALLKGKVRIDEGMRLPIEKVETIECFGMEVDNEFLLGRLICRSENENSSLCLRCEKEHRRGR